MGVAAILQVNDEGYLCVYDKGVGVMWDPGWLIQEGSRELISPNACLSWSPSLDQSYFRLFSSQKMFDVGITTLAYDKLSEQLDKY